MSECSVFFNSPYLGGAERSLGLQVKDYRRKASIDSLQFYIPYISDKKEALDLSRYLMELGFDNSSFNYFKFDSVLYGLSRSHPLISALTFPFTCFALVRSLGRLSYVLEKMDGLWWVGGSKIGFLVFLLGVIKGFKGRFLWHFRDYLFAQGIYKIQMILFKLPRKFQFDAVGNSQDVCLSIKKATNRFDHIYPLYNPVEKLPFSVKENGPLVLGTASMFAPWKGLHSLILFASLYEESLKEMGISSFKVYGGEIYKTKGDHLGYGKSLRVLQEKLGSTFISFEGLKPPHEVFKDLDIFIHGSLKPEPFGRVIVEAYRSGTGLISTGLGGAGELVSHEETGFVFKPYDNEGLFQAIKKLAGSDRGFYLQRARLKADELQSEYEKQLEGLFSF